MTREPQKDPPAIVQPPPSKKAMNISPNETAARNAFQYTLEFLGKTPVPGIGLGAVTDVLLHVVKGIQVRVSRLSQYLDSNTNFICAQEIPQVEAGGKELAERMTCLSFLMSKSAELKLQEIERYCTPLTE